METTTYTLRQMNKDLIEMRDVVRKAEANLVRQQGYSRNDTQIKRAETRLIKARTAVTNQILLIEANTPAPTVEDIAAAIAATKAGIVTSHAIIREQEETIRLAEEHLATLERDMMRAAATADTNVLPIGARVQHSTFDYILGTVVEGTDGVTVRMDGQDTTNGGYTAAEWVVIGATA